MVYKSGALSIDLVQKLSQVGEDSEEKFMYNETLLKVVDGGM